MVNDSENQKYCGTHGNPLDNNGCCEKCRVDWDNRYELSQEKKKMTNEEYAKWKSEYFMGEETLNSLLIGKKSDYDKYLNEGIIGNKDWFKSYQYSKDEYLIQKYFCDNCKIVQFHHLQYCPKCGGKFVSRKMTGKEFNKNYSDYRAGY